MIVSVDFPTDEGFWGRECKSCDKYFKIYIDDLKDKNFCAYCGEEFEDEELRTKKQQKEIRRVAEQVAVSEFQKMMDSVFRPKKTKYLKYKPGKRVKVTPPKTHLEKDVDSQIHCDCGTRFQVYGIFGFCPGCRDENIHLFEADLKIILRDLERSENKPRQLRLAYYDLVSTFETFAKQYGIKIGITEKTSFQNLTNVRKRFKSEGIDIFETLNAEEKEVIKRVFYKRHSQHSQIKVTEEYLKAFPRDKVELGQKLEFVEEEFIDATEILKKVIEQMIKTA